MTRMTWSAILLGGLVGCAPTSISRQFDVGYADAEQKLHGLYPSAPVGTAGKVPAGLKGPVISIRRDEVSTDGEILIVIKEGAKTVDRTTQVVLKDLSGNRSEVSVQTSTINKAVIFPPRDKAYELVQMDEIAKALK